MHADSTKGNSRDFYTTLQCNNFPTFLPLHFFWLLTPTSSYQIEHTLLAFSNQLRRNIEHKKIMSQCHTHFKPGLAELKIIIFNAQISFVTSLVDVCFLPTIKCSPLQSLINIIMKQVDYLM